MMLHKIEAKTLQIILRLPHVRNICLVAGLIILMPLQSISADEKYLSCENWFKGKISGYLFWGKASEIDIKYCVSKYGINRRDQFNSTPLLHALAYRNVSFEKIKLLVSSGADIHSKNKFGVTPLIMAARYSKDIQIVELLIANGARKTDRDAYGSNAADVILINPNFSKSEKAELLKVLLKDP